MPTLKNGCVLQRNIMRTKCERCKYLSKVWNEVTVLASEAKISTCNPLSDGACGNVQNLSSNLKLMYKYKVTNTISQHPAAVRARPAVHLFWRLCIKVYSTDILYYVCNFLIPFYFGVFIPLWAFSDCSCFPTTKNMCNRSGWFA